MNLIDLFILQQIMIVSINLCTRNTIFLSSFFRTLRNNIAKGNQLTNIS